MALNIQPFSFNAFYKGEPIRPILNGDWGPPDQSKQFQETIASLLPTLAKAYTGTREELKAQSAEANVRRIGASPGQQVTQLAQPGAPYGPANPVSGGYNPAGKLPSFAGGTGTKTMPAAPEVVQAVTKHATAAGLNPEDVLTAMSYETGGTLDPWKKGPTTKWGEHRGLIQWGEPQRAQYGITADSSVDQQVAATIQYLQDRGVKPGMGMLEIYSAINAGGVGPQYASRSDTAAGGAPGTVADKVANQMVGHRAKAQALLKTYGSGDTGTAVASAMRTAPDLIGVAAKMGITPEQLSRMGDTPEFLEAMRTGRMKPSPNDPSIWTIDGKPVERPDWNEVLKSIPPGTVWQATPEQMRGARPVSAPVAAAGTSVTRGDPRVPAGASTGYGVAPTADDLRREQAQPPVAAVAGASGAPYNATQPVPPNQQIQPTPGMAPSQIQQPVQQAAQPAPQAPFQGSPVQPQPQVAAAAQAPPQARQTPPPGVQIASAEPGFVPGSPAPGPGIGINDQGQRIAVDANGNPIPVPPPAPRPAVAAAPAPAPAPAPQGDPASTGGVSPASPIQLAQAAAQVDPNFRNALADAIGSRNPNVMRGVLEAGKELLGGPGYDFVNGPDGNLYRVNKQTGIPELAVRGPGKGPVTQEVGGVLYQWDGQQWRPVAGQPETWRNATPEEITAAGADPKTSGPMQINSKTGEIKFPGKNTGVNVSVGAGEKAEEVELGKERAKQQVDLTKQSQGAAVTLAQISRMRTLLDATDTGKLSPAINTLSMWGRAAGISDDTLRSLGFDPKDAINAEAIHALSGAFLSQKLSSGEFPSNNFSNADRGFLEGQLPGLGKSREANKIILDAMEEGSRRSVAKQRAWYQARAKGTSWDDFQGQWLDYLDTQPNFFQSQIDAAKGGGGGGGAPAQQWIIGPDGNPRRVK